MISWTRVILHNVTGTSAHLYARKTLKLHISIFSDSVELNNFKNVNEASMDYWNNLGHFTIWLWVLLAVSSWQEIFHRLSSIIAHCIHTPAKANDKSGFHKGLPGT